MKTTSAFTGTVPALRRPAVLDPPQRGLSLSPDRRFVFPQAENRPRDPENKIKLFSRQVFITDGN